MLDKDEIWSRKIGELAGDVADVLRASCVGGDAALESTDEIVADVASEILAGRFHDFVVITRHIATGATYHVTAAFLFDEFRGALTTAAHQRLARIVAHA